jgi:hypothetical protein
MPSFETFILGAPIGFSHGCSALNELFDEDKDSLLNQLSHHILKSKKKCFDDKNSVVNKNSQCAINSALYIYQAVKQSTPSLPFSALSNILDSNTNLSKDCLEQILHHFETINKEIETLPELVIFINSIFIFNYKF